MLGLFAWCLTIIRGLWLDLHINHTLVSGLVVFLVFSALGFCLGKIFDRAFRELEERRFREEMTRLNIAVASNEASKLKQQAEVGMASGQGSR
jgi:hypothetical protein